MWASQTKHIIRAESCDCGVEKECLEVACSEATLAYAQDLTGILHSASIFLAGYFSAIGGKGLDPASGLICRKFLFHVLLLAAIDVITWEVLDHLR